MEQYDRVLAFLLDNYAPLKKSVITIRPENFWSTELVEEARRRARAVWEKMDQSEIRDWQVTTVEGPRPSHIIVWRGQDRAAE